MDEERNDDISVFRYDYFFLSNFYPCKVTIDGLTYNSSEAAFQAQKTLDRDIRNMYTTLSPVEAKLHGKHVKLREDWDDVKVGIMEHIVREKFKQNEDLMQKLLDTGDRNLVELNNWNDTFWGVSRRTGKGENRLGKILMKVRGENERTSGE